MKRFPTPRRAALFVLLLAAALPAGAAQAWFTQGVSITPADALRLSFSNTAYTEHGEHYANEEAASFRWSFASNWSAGAGITFSQNRTKDQGWDFSGRPSEHLALDWKVSGGGWSFLDSNRLYLYFREGVRDWVVYRNIATLTSPEIPRLPWEPRLYLTQYVYVTGRDGYCGADRFSQFRTIAGVRLRPLDGLSLAAYWHYRDIETRPGEWKQVRIVGLSAFFRY